MYGSVSSSSYGSTGLLPVPSEPVGDSYAPSLDTMLWIRCESSRFLRLEFDPPRWQATKCVGDSYLRAFTAHALPMHIIAMIPEGPAGTAYVAKFAGRVCKDLVMADPPLVIDGEITTALQSVDGAAIEAVAALALEHQGVPVTAAWLEARVVAAKKGGNVRNISAMQQLSSVLVQTNVPRLRTLGTTIMAHVARAGRVQAARFLADAYKAGTHGLVMDKLRSIRWLAVACAYGDPDAVHMIASEMIFAPPTALAGARLMLVAARLGIAEAAMVAASCFLAGWALPVSLIDAHALAVTAYRRGLDAAQVLIAEIALTMASSPLPHTTLGIGLRCIGSDLFDTSDGLVTHPAWTRVGPDDDIMHATHAVDDVNGANFWFQEMAYHCAVTRHRAAAAGVQRVWHTDTPYCAEVKARQAPLDAILDAPEAVLDSILSDVDVVTVPRLDGGCLVPFSFMHRLATYDHRTAFPVPTDRVDVRIPMECRSEGTLLVKGHSRSRSRGMHWLGYSARDAEDTEQLAVQRSRERRVPMDLVDPAIYSNRRASRVAQVHTMIRTLPTCTSYLLPPTRPLAPPPPSEAEQKRMQEGNDSESLTSGLQWGTGHPLTSYANGGTMLLFNTMRLAPRASVGTSWSQCLSRDTDECLRWDTLPDPGVAVVLQQAMALYTAATRAYDQYVRGYSAAPANLNATHNDPAAGAIRTNFERAARLGHRDAMFAYGQLLRAGFGGPIDAPHGLMFIRAAALHGHLGAMYCIGRHDIVTCTRDTPEWNRAHQWIHLAARFGQPHAAYYAAKHLVDGKELQFSYLRLGMHSGHDAAVIELNKLATKMAAEFMGDVGVVAGRWPRRERPVDARSLTDSEVFGEFDPGAWEPDDRAPLPPRPRPLPRDPSIQ